MANTCTDGPRPAGRCRADVLLVAQGLAPTRARAQALILAGAVLADNGFRVEKPGSLMLTSATLRLKGEPLPYVSRGGLKLAAALKTFAVQPVGLTCLDVGASTGGFTDCLLQHGARRVYAIDVGYGQLAWSLRQDPRVTVIERCNVRTAPAEQIPELCTMIVIDVSFISLGLIMPAVLRWAAPGARVVALVKPQFEVGRAAIGKGGIVRSSEAREEALLNVIHQLGALALQDIQTMASPVLGAKGNHEFLLSARCPKG